MTLSRQAVVADWEGNPAPEAPLMPESLKESGLTLGFICDIKRRYEGLGRHKLGHAYRGCRRGEYTDH